MALAASLAVALSLAALGAVTLTDGCAARKYNLDRARTPDAANAGSQQTDAPCETRGDARRRFGGGQEFPEVTGKNQGLHVYLR